jgi:hypothetical protein
MQLAGAPCSICSQNVKFESDATWCASCKAVIHRDCLSQHDHLCPTCKRPYDPPESHFVFSKFCPECMKLNEPPQPQCSVCHARTQWDTKNDYEQFVTQMKGVAHVRFLRGVVELIGGLLCVLALIGTMSFSPILYGLFLFAFGFITLTADGIVSILKSRKIRQFK